MPSRPTLPNMSQVPIRATWTEVPPTEQSPGSELETSLIVIASILN